MKERILEDLKNAMKNQDKDTLSTIRLLKGALQLEEINKKGELTEDEIIAIVSKQIKTRKESIAEFDDLYDSSNKSPHCIFLRAMPIYLTFHHINTVAPYAIDEYEDEFIRLCNKLTTDESAGYDMFHYMKQNRFYRSEEDIYRILGKKGKVKTFEQEYKAFSTGKSNIEENAERLFICQCY